jgi:hypothetical protein
MGNKERHQQWRRLRLPTYLTVFRSELCILRFFVAPSQDRTWVLYIVFFVKTAPSSQSLQQWDLRGGDGPHHMARKLGRVVDPLFHLVAFSVDY